MISDFIVRFKGERLITIRISRSKARYELQGPLRVDDERVMAVLDKGSIRRILSVRRRDCVPTVNLRRRLCLTSIPALLVKGKLRCILACRNVSRRWADKWPLPSHTASHVAHTSWRPAEDMGNCDQGRPRTDLQTANLWPHTMGKGLGESV